MNQLRNQAPSDFSDAPALSVVPAKTGDPPSARTFHRACMCRWLGIEHLVNCLSKGKTVAEQREGLYHTYTVIGAFSDLEEMGVFLILVVRLF